MFIQISLIINKSAKAKLDIKKQLVLERLIPKEEKLYRVDNPGEARLDMVVKGECKDFDKLTRMLKKSVSVISVIGINIIDDIVGSKETVTASELTGASGSIKSECEKLLISFFGKNGADDIVGMEPEEALAYSRGKVAGLIGEDAAKAFDQIG